MDNIAILASGSGSNAEAIIRHFSLHHSIQVVCVITNRESAGVRERAERLSIPHFYFSNADMRSGEEPIALLRRLNVQLIALAGYMCLITPPWIEAFPMRILNIHPALLPAYGGKGMYGHHVHEAVIAARQSVSGITIHLVDEEYDHGRHLLQATCPVHDDDTPDSLACRIHALEHRYYASTIEHYLLNELIS